MADEDYSRTEILELSVIEAVHLDLDHVREAETRAYDARLGTVPVDIKTCQRWVSHAGSNGGRRRGGFAINRSAHERLAEYGGMYLFAVRENGDVIAWTLWPADQVWPLLTWTTNPDDRNGERALLQWRDVIPTETLKMDGKQV